MDSQEYAKSRVLIIDDEVVQRTIMRRVAEQMNCDVICADSFEEVWRLLPSQAFDVVVVDLSLGDRDGIELLRMIAELPYAPRVIVVSGCEYRILAATARMARASGIVDVESFTKPLDLTALRAAIERPRPFLKATGESPAIASINRLDISNAIRDREFVPVFQPKIDLTNGRLTGCEALTRWKSPKLGIIPPCVFVTMAEKTGQIHEMTTDLLRDSLNIAHDIIQTNPDFVLAVNLSSAMLSDLTLPEQIEQILTGAGVAGKSLMLEVTETAAMADVARATDILIRLRLKGIGLAIDDFGTGYSSLAALARMPFSELKIDQSFVKSCLTDGDTWKVVRASIAMAHELKMKVVAEGIEDLETWELLKSVSCDIGQGYYFSKPLSHHDLLEWQRAWARQHSAAA